MSVKLHKIFYEQIQMTTAFGIKENNNDWIQLPEEHSPNSKISALEPKEVVGLLEAIMTFECGIESMLPQFHSTVLNVISQWHRFKGWTHINWESILPHDLLEYSWSLLWNLSKAQVKHHIRECIAVWKNKQIRVESRIKRRVLELTPAHQQAFARKMVSLSSLISFGGSLRASRVAGDALKNSNHLILKLGDALAVAMSWSFSKVSSGAEELIV